MKKITSKYLEELIVSEDYVKVGKKTVVCILTLKNGFEVIAYSGVINPEDFDMKTGQAIAYEKAFDKLWELEGYKQH